MLLGFPQPSPNIRGYVPLRVVARELFYFTYDPIVEGQITGPVPAAKGLSGVTDLGFIAPTRPGSQTMTGKPFNALLIRDNDKLYQLFIGIAPSALRLFIEAPSTVGQRNLEIDRWASTRLQFGYVDGFDSPFLRPSPRSELVIPPDFDISIGYGNPLPVPVSPLLLFVVNHLQVGVITDPDLVHKMLNGMVPTSIKTVGGLSSFDYPVEEVYGIEPLPLGASREEVAVKMAKGAPAPPAPPGPPPRPPFPPFRVTR